MCVCVCVCVVKLITTIQVEGEIYWEVGTTAFWFYWTIIRTMRGDIKDRTETLNRAESTWEINKYGKYINQFLPNIIKWIRHYEKIKKKICSKKMSIMLNEIYIYIYIYVQDLSKCNGTGCVAWVMGERRISIYTYCLII